MTMRSTVAFSVAIISFRRSCVIGLGVLMPSSWRSMAFASKTPTQMGRKLLSSESRRMTTGMFAIGSTIRALTSILTGTATPLSPRIWERFRSDSRGRSSRRDFGHGSLDPERARKEGVRKTLFHDGPDEGAGRGAGEALD